MILDYDPVTSLRHWPTPMLRFGTNPYGDPLYRIVFAQSRRHLVCGTWPDGSNCAKYVQTYRIRMHEQWKQGRWLWVMERWLPAELYAKCSKEAWDLILGPWPERGDYELCHAFEIGPNDDASIEKLIGWVEIGRNTSFFETQRWHQADAAREAKEVDSLQDAMIRDKLAYKINSPLSGYGGGRNTKTQKIMKSAEELGLPTQGGQRRTRRSPNAPTFEVPLSL